MRRKIIITADGSKTIQIEDWNEQYHSIHGAIQEANYVYIKHGLLFSIEQTMALQPIASTSLDILEIGFGTGLNALLTLLKSIDLKQPINYVGVEAFPVKAEELALLNYASELNIDPLLLNTLHSCSWEDTHSINDTFQLTKQNKLFKDISEIEQYDLIYFDAFGARVQPELWTKDIFEIMYAALRSNGVLTTYSAKGSVRRSMLEVGFEVEKLTGPPVKRHMLRAHKR